MMAEPKHYMADLYRESQDKLATKQAKLIHKHEEFIDNLLDELCENKSRKDIHGSIVKYLNENDRTRNGR